jgi:hypothetical protein
VRVGVQWSEKSPKDWMWLDITSSGAGSRRWRNLPKRPVPTGGEVLDGPGWIFDLVVQGVHFAGHDHYAVEPTPQGVKVTVWTDDLEDVETNYAWGQVWTFLPPAPDGRFAGRVNTVQYRTVFSEDLVDIRRFVPEGLTTSGGPVELLPWSEFPVPPDVIVRHGIWLDDELFKAHAAARRPVDWKEWVA